MKEKKKQQRRRRRRQKKLEEERQQKELARERHLQLAHERQKLIAQERLPRELIPKLLLKLCESPSYYDPHHVVVLHKALAACCLVCHHWSQILWSYRGRFMMKAHGKVWQSPTFSWYMLRHAPRVLRDVEETNAGLLPENYTATLIASRKFLPELATSLILWLTWGEDQSHTDLLTRIATLRSCCLVSREWNTVFTPLLYEVVHITRRKSASLLRHIFKFTHPSHKRQVKTVIIEHAQDGSTANSLSLCFAMPNLQEVVFGFPSQVFEFDPAALHAKFAWHLNSLSRRCTIQMLENREGRVEITRRTLPRHLNLMRSSRSTSYNLWVESEDEKTSVELYTYFYDGEREASVGGIIGSEDTKRFEQLLTQIGNDLKGLSLTPYELSSLPKIDLSTYPQLRLLRFSFRDLGWITDGVIKWFSSICESVISQSLVIRVDSIPQNQETCKKIQNILLAMNARVETLSVHLYSEGYRWPGEELTRYTAGLDELSRKAYMLSNEVRGREENMQQLFPRLSEKGILVAQNTPHHEDECWTDADIV